MSRGGSRFGAGRPSWHVKAEHLRSIDARRWAREGLLAPGKVGGWAWRDPDTGATTASIGYAAEAGAVVLSFTSDDEAVRQRVPILETGCNYGGGRQWFACPRCGRRVAVLYLRGARFACRHCQRAAYASQSEDEMGRAWRKQRKAEAKLGANWRRPKGMHRATRERLLAVIWECERRREDALAAFLSRWLPQLERMRKIAVMSDEELLRHALTDAQGRERSRKRRRDVV